MKKLEIKDLSTNELVQMVSDEQMNLVKLKINHKVSDIENPKLITKTKRNIARFLTEIRAREIQQKNM